MKKWQDYRTERDKVMTLYDGYDGLTFLERFDE